MVGVLVDKVPNLLFRHLSKKPMFKIRVCIISVFPDQRNPFLLLGRHIAGLFMNFKCRAGG